MNVSRIKLVGVALAIFAATVWLYWPSVHGEFLAGDDLEYLRQSERWNGLTWNAVTWAFTSTDSYYHPLSRLSHVLDYQIWRKNAAGHHATSVVVHALNAALVFGFLWTLLGATFLTTGERRMAALWVAVVFAIHPLQTESVAWMSGRTQLLCTMFCIGSLWAYAAGARRWVVWGFFVLAVLSKPMAVSLPFVMLAMDYYPLRQHERLGSGRLVWEKAAMMAVAGLVGVATVMTKARMGGVMALSAKIPLSLRLFLMFESLTFYPLKLVWPARLSPDYPIFWDLSLNQWPVLTSVLSVVVITAVVVVERRRRPMLGAGWGAYGALVLPVSGLMLTGAQSVELRYAYMAMLPLLLLAGGAVIWVWRRSSAVARMVMAGLLAGQLGAFAMRTRNLIPDWHDNKTRQRAVTVALPDSEEANRLFAMMLLDEGRAGEALPYAQRDVQIAPKLSYSHTTLGSVLRRLGRLQEAVAEDELAFRTNPDAAEAHYNYGTALMQSGKVPEAAEHFEQTLRIKPDFAEAHDNLGISLAQTGKLKEAIRHFEQALRIDPDSAEAHFNLGNALAQTGKIEEAIQHYEQALRIRPDFADAHCNLGIALAQTGKTEEAIAHYERALRTTPDFTQAHYNLAIALAQTGKFEEAIPHYERVLRIKPDFAKAHYKLGIALAQTGKTEEAIAHYEQVLRIEPDNAAAHNNLGIALMGLGRMPEAIGHLEQALRINPQYAEAHSNLGLALYRTGKHEEAIDHYQQALRIDPDYAEAHINLGNAFLREGKGGDAIGQYEQALRIKPDNAAAHYSLGIALGQAGRIPEAIEHLKQALRINPDFTQAQSALTQLQARQ